MVELLVFKDNIDLVIQSHANTSHASGAVGNVEAQHTFHNPRPIDESQGTSQGTQLTQSLVVHLILFPPLTPPQ